MPELPTFVAWLRRQPSRPARGGVDYGDLVGYVREHGDIPDGADFAQLLDLLTAAGALAPTAGARPAVQLASLTAAQRQYQSDAEPPPDPRRRRVRITTVEATAGTAAVYVLDARTGERLAAFKRRAWAEAFVASMGWEPAR